jgi:hypothetical protein
MCCDALEQSEFTVECPNMMMMVFFFWKVEETCKEAPLIAAPLFSGDANTTRFEASGPHDIGK